MSKFLRKLERAISDYDVARKSRSGTKWTEAQYKAAGIQLLHLRLKPEHHEPLDELCELWGVSRGEATKRAVAEAHARHVAPYVRPPAEQAPDESFEQTIPPKALNKRSGESE